MDEETTGIANPNPSEYLTETMSNFIYFDIIPKNTMDPLRAIYTHIKLYCLSQMTKTGRNTANHTEHLFNTSLPAN